MQSFKSILNINNNNSIKLWKKASSSQKTDINNNINNINLLQALKKSGKNKQVVRRFFSVRDSNLFSFNEDSSLVKVVLSLEFCRIEVEPSAIPSAEFTLRVIRQDKFVEIYIKNKEELANWREALRPFVIFHDIHSIYSSGSQIGEGAFGKVFALKRKTD